MSDSVAWCILAGFKITSVFSRIIYHTIESICEFAVSILQGYIYGGKNSVNFNVPKRNQRKRKPIKLIGNESRNSEEPQNKSPYCKTNESTDMTKSVLTSSGQRFCFHGTDKIMECNLHDARKVTVSFDFYPSRNHSMIGFGFPSDGAQDPQKEMVENDNSSEKTKISPRPKQANGQLNQNGIERNESKLKYKDVTKLSHETLFMTDGNMHAAKNVLEVASDGKDVSINGCRASYKKDSGALSDEQYIEHSVVHLSQGTESLVDKRVTHKQDSLDSAGKQWTDNHTFGERQKPNKFFDHSCDNKQDSKILVDEEMRATTINTGYIAKSPEHSDKNQTTSNIEKQIQETLSEKKQSDIKKDGLIHLEQYQIPSAHLPITLLASDTDTVVPETFADEYKLLTPSTSDKKNRHGQDSPVDRKPKPAFPVNENNLVSESTAEKNLMTASFESTNPGLMAPANTHETSTSALKAGTLTNNNEKPEPVPVAHKKPTLELATDNINSDCPVNKDKRVRTPAVNEPVPTHEAKKDKPLPVLAIDKLKPKSPANKDNSILPSAVGKKSVTASVVDKPMRESPVDNDKNPIPELVRDKAKLEWHATKESVTAPEINKDKSLPVLSDENFTSSSNANKEVNSVPAEDKKRIPPSEARKEPVSESAVDKKHILELGRDKKTKLERPTNKKSVSAPEINEDKPLPVPAAEELTPSSFANKEKPVPAEDKIIPPSEDGKEPVLASAVEKKHIQELGTDKEAKPEWHSNKESVAAPESNKENPLPVPADEKLTPSSPANKEKHVPVEDKIIPQSEDCEEPVSASAVEKKHILELGTDKEAKPEWHSNKESVPAPEMNKEKPLPVPADEKLTPSSPANKEKHVLVEDKIIPPSEAGKEPVSASAVDKKHIPELGTDKTKPEWPANKSVPAPEMNEDKPLPVPADDNLTPSSNANKEKPVPTEDKIIPPSEDCEEPVSAPAVDKKSTPKSPANDDKKPVPASAVDKPTPESLATNDNMPIQTFAADKKSTLECPANDKPMPVPTADKKRTPESPANENKKPVPEPISQKTESSTPVSLANQKPVTESVADKINIAIPESTTDKHIPASAIDKTPISATVDSYRVENVSEVSEKFAVREINEDGDIDSSFTKEFRSKREPIDTGGSNEEFSEDFNEMLEKGPSIVIGPDILLNPTCDSGNSRHNDSKSEMSSRYMQDGWDDSDKCFYEYVIEREKEMGQFDPSAFKNECLNEMARPDENKSKGENIQRDSSKYGKIIDKYNPLTEVPKYYDLITIVDSKYILTRSRIKCYKKREVTDNVAGTDGTNTDYPNEPSTSHQYNTEKQSTRETGKANFREGISAFGESSITLQESQKNVKTLKELGARPKTSRGTRK